MDITQHTLPPTINPVVRNQQTEMDERAMKALLRKIDLRLIPCLAVIFFFNYLDRNNIGNASLFGLADDIPSLQSDYYWVVSIFVIAYILCGVPSILLMRRWGPSKWIPGMVLAWGIILMSMTLVYNLTGLLAARFFLGMAEAGFLPGVVFYLSLWYIRKDQAFRIGIFTSSGILACAFDGILGYGIQQLGNGGCFAKWQWFFLAEGVATVCLAILSYKFLADPSTVQWLDQCEKDILTARLIADVKVIGDDDNESLFNQIRLVLLDWQVWLYLLISTGAVLPMYSLNLFLPKIIEDEGYNHPNSELFLAPPYFVSCLATIISSWNAGRLNERSNHIMILLLIEISGFLYLILAQTNLYIGAIIVGIGVFSANTLILSWITNNTVDKTKRAIVAALVAGSDNIAGILSGQIYRQSDKASYHQGHYIVIGILSLTFVITLLLKLLLKYENRRRRNLPTIPLHWETVADERQIQLHKYPGFIYVT